MTYGYASAIKQLREQVGNLLAKHEETRDLVVFSEYANDPAGFMRDVLHCEPWEMQIEMARRVRDHARTVVVTANGVGKDWAVARFALHWVYALRGFVILTGPTERQVKHILMRDVRKAFTAAPELPGELYALELRVGDAGDCGILAFTSDQADRLTGFHHPRLLICMTEAQGIDDSAFEAAYACATAPGNRLFAYGNPTRPTGAFYRAAQSDNWSVLTIPATAHPNVVSGRAEIPGAVSREWIELMAAEYGTNSSIYRARVLALFPTESVEGLIKREWIRAAFDRHESGALFTQIPRPPLLALDVARFGPDSSVLAILRGPVVQELVTWHGSSITESADKVIQQAEYLAHLGRQAPRPKIVVDAPGLGGGCIDVLRSRGWTTIEFNGAAAAPNPQRFLNLRAASYWHFRELLEHGRIALPRDALLEEEALAVEWQLTPSGHIQMISKDLIRHAIGRSPDRLDAVVIGLTESVPGFRPRWGMATWSY